MNENTKISARDAYYDNLRLFLIFITVYCHGLATMRKTHPFINDLYLILLLFVMPLFVALSGFFAKGMAKAGSSKRMQIVNFVFIYAIFQLLKNFLVGSGAFFTPTYGNWYLTCIILWYAALPAIAKFRPVVVMIVSIVAALLIGMDSGTSTVLQTSRLLCFLSFFMVGFYLTKEQAELLKKPNIRLFGVFVFIGVVAICLTAWNDAVPYMLMHAYKNYAQLKLSNLTGASFRLAWYVLATAMGFGVLCIIPRKRTKLTVLGSRTLPIFLVHTTIYHYLIRKTDFFDYIAAIDSGYIRLTVITLLSIVVTLVCGNKFFAKAFDWLVKYDFHIFMKSNADI